MCDLVSRDRVRDFGDADCIEGVGDAQNPGSKRDESSPDAVRIARSVPSFVVVGHEDGSLSEKEERFEKQGAKPRMILHGDIDSESSLFTPLVRW
jgi:hypothetical protein